MSACWCGVTDVASQAHAAWCDGGLGERRLELVGWRSPRTGNLLRPGPRAKNDWAARGFEPVFRIVPRFGDAS